MFDVEFVFVLYDKVVKKVVVGCDLIGIWLMFYGYIKERGEIVFGFMVKILMDLCD